MPIVTYACNRPFYIKVNFGVKVYNSITFHFHSPFITYWLEHWSANFFCRYLRNCDAPYQKPIFTITVSSLTARVIKFYYVWRFFIESSWTFFQCFNYSIYLQFKLETMMEEIYPPLLAIGSTASSQCQISQLVDFLRFLSQYIFFFQKNK
jgi:hypothetical protein